MILLSDCDKYKGLYFYPYYVLEEWDESWIDNLIKLIEDVSIILKKYIIVPNNIPMVLVPAPLCPSIKASIHKSKEIIASTFKQYIILFVQDKHFFWTDYLIHEMFHYSVFQCTSNNYIMPDWFNESIAYYLTDKYSKNSVTQIFRNNAFIEMGILLKGYNKIIMELLLNDKLESNQKLNKTHKYCIYKTMGEFIYTIFHENEMKSFYTTLSSSYDFNQLLKEHFAISVKELILKWIDRIEKEYEQTRVAFDF